MVFHFLGTVVPLCTPHILVDIVVEIDMGTQVITHSPNAIHFAAHIVAIYRYSKISRGPFLSKYPFDVYEISSSQLLTKCPRRGWLFRTTKSHQRASLAEKQQACKGHLKGGCDLITRPPKSQEHAAKVKKVILWHTLAFLLSPSAPACILEL